MGNLELNLIIIGSALILSGLSVFLFYKNKLGKNIMLAVVSASLSIAITVVALISILLEPKITLKGSYKMEIPVFGEYTESGYSATLGNDDVTDAVTVSGKVDTSVVGRYDIIYSYKNGKKVYKTTRTVNVTDKVAPEIKLNGKNKIIVSDMKFYKESGAAATDNYDGELTENIKITKKKINDEKYNIIYTVADLSGNKSTLIREIEIKDIVAPVITLKGKSTIYINVGGKYTEQGATAKDDMDGDLTDKLKISGSVNTAMLGTYIRSYSVTDSCGNKKTVTRRVVVRVPEDPTKNRICLTFDDGPSNVTITVLDILKKNNVKATFFICNYDKSKLPIIKRMINEGHAIGIHGYSHDYGAIYKSEAAFMNNINKLHDKLYKDTGYDSKIMRFPGGSSNTVSNRYSKGIMKKLKVRVTNEGWRYFDWNVSSGDASGSLSSNAIYKNTISGLKKKRTNVVLMHDLGTKKTTAGALQKIIDYANDNSYSFWAIDDSIPQIVH
ncbi:MAG: DUF5011 domain-containing protein [Acutalibacteraceae bacterium]|nr:DUF5011 domain-containing protein [Acutalibacteraceae bacterium]